MSENTETVSISISSGLAVYPGYTMQLIEDNLLELKFEKGFEGELEDAQLIVSRIASYCKNNEPVLLLVVYAEDNIFSKEARQYVASKEVNRFVKAEALVIHGMALRIMGNFYLKMNKPARASKLFNDRSLGLEWLRKKL